MLSMTCNMMLRDLCMEDALLCQEAPEYARRHGNWQCMLHMGVFVQMKASMLSGLVDSGAWFKRPLRQHSSQGAP